MPFGSTEAGTKSEQWVTFCSNSTYTTLGHGDQALAWKDECTYSKTCLPPTLLLWPRSGWPRMFMIMSSQTCGLLAFLIWIPSIHLGYCQGGNQWLYNIKDMLKIAILNVMNKNQVFSTFSCFQGYLLD